LHEENADNFVMHLGKSFGNFQILVS